MKNFRSGLIFLAGLSLFSLKSFPQSTTADISIIPQPASIKVSTGVFIINALTKIAAPAGGFTNEVVQLNELIKGGLGIKLKPGAGLHSIKLVYDSALPQDGYKLNITPAQVTLSASTSTGMFYAVETIRQLLPASVENKREKLVKLQLPALNITDYPAYKWRGMHLDVSRHFFSIAYLHKFIDVMALYKMNKFHIHLTDDQGWRMEIKQYPNLTAQGAWRTFNNQDSACIKLAKENPDFAIDPQHIVQKDGKTMYGGFYTQQQLKDLVAYAATKHVEIIPEIDMPGHMMAAINSYPFLTCNGDNSFGALFSKPICPCNENTFEFAQHIFDEVMSVFPSPYIHIGGDEVDRTDWAKSEACKAMMKREGIKNLEDLHSYFINRMEKYFNSKGKKLIGWDEVIEGGISPTATIMYWRSWVPDAPVKAAKNGNPVIMTPGDPLYFDRQPDKNSLTSIYHFNPIPAGLKGNETKAIIGAQANIWTEYIPTEARADYMLMPRMTALAERLWTNNTNNFDGFMHRLNGQYQRLDNLKVHYRLPDLPDMISEHVFTDQTVLNIKKPLENLTLHYTNNGTLPQASSPVLDGPLIINSPQTIKVAAFSPSGLRGDIYTLNYKKETYAVAATAVTRPGLKVNYFKDNFKKTSGMDSAKPDSTFTTMQIEVPSSVKAPAFGLSYTGYIDVPAQGVYAFYLLCDDGGVLKIANRTVVDNDGNHSPIEKNGQVALAKGLQPFRLDFIEAGGGFKLELRYSLNGSAPEPLPASWLKN